MQLMFWLLGLVAVLTGGLALMSRRSGGGGPRTQRPRDGESSNVWGRAEEASDNDGE